MAAFSPCRILVVDDCATNRALLAAILSHRSILFDVASDGQEALSKLEDLDFDVVLMDIQMPIMDGFAATAAIRKKWPLRNIAIVAVTASTGDQPSETYTRAGFSNKIHKPFGLREIDALLSHYAVGRALAG